MNPSLTFMRSELLAKLAAMWASFPPHVKYEPSAWSQHSTNVAIMLLMVRLEALYTEFILHKLVVDQDHSSRSMLIETSHLILSLLLSALSQRLVLAQYRIDLEWSVSSILDTSWRDNICVPNLTNIEYAVSVLRHALRQRPHPRTSAPDRAAAATHHNQPFHAHPRLERANLLLRLAH